MKYNYESVVNTIQNTRRFGTLTGYEVSKRMLEQLGNPQKEIPFVHIAGTNGKGSTTAFLCEILKQAGLKVGMFTSPHLVTFEERIRINGEYIPKEDVTRLGNQLLGMEFDVPPTMFDYCLCMAVLYFQEQNCDLMVMETGIGGRFDSTNALGTPLVSVITKIGFDHMAILGNTLEEIAYEKAGIIKKGVPVVLQKQEETAREVICDYVLQINCESETEKKQSNIVKDENNENAKRKDDINRNQNTNENDTRKANPQNPYFGNENDRCKYLIEVSQPIRDYVSKLPRKMLGNFQIENAATALLTAVCILEERVWHTENENRFCKEKLENKNKNKVVDEENGNNNKVINFDSESSFYTDNNKILKTEPIKDNLKNESTKAKGYEEQVASANGECSLCLPNVLQSLPEVYLNAIEQGISQAVWKGRMELVNEYPFFMIDGAHNPDGVHALAESLQTLYPKEKFHFIMAVMADKDYETMIEELIPLAIDFVTVTPEYNRALQAKELAECIAKKGIKASYAEKLEDVIVPLLPLKDTIKEKKTKAVNGESQDVMNKINDFKMNNCKTTQETENSDRKSKTIAFGSLYFIGEIEALL